MGGGQRHPGALTGTVSSTVTLVFTDIVGSTERTSKVGDDTWVGALRRHNDIVRSEVGRHQGREVKTMGDGFMLAFSSARDAVACALAIQEAVDPEVVPLRVGVHTGEVVEEGDDYLGHHVNVAARVMQAAGSGEVLVSAVVRELLLGSREFAIGPERRLLLAGIDEPFPAFAVTAVGYGRVAVGILGPVEVRVGGRLVALGAPKERSVLALLATAGGATVSTDRLVDELWPALPPARGRASLHVRVSALRKLLAVSHEPPIVSDPHGYRLATGDDGLDSARFEALIRDARVEVGQGDHELAARTYAAALGLWRGDALEDAKGCPALEAEARRLDGLRLDAVEEQLEAELACGLDHEVAARADGLVAQHPLRERLWAALMIALYRSGRQAESLAAYQRLRAALVDELGIEPSPHLRALERAVLDQDPALHGPPRAPSAERPVSPGAGAIPPAIELAGATALVGRESELGRLQACWQETVDGGGSSAFVIGPAGIGKTRLVAELALDAHRGGALVAFGRCDEEAVSPYQPIREMLATVWRACPHAFLDAARHDLAAVARLLPDLLEVTTVAADTGEDDRYALFESTAEVLSLAAAAQPLLLVIDDVQWADGPTLQLVRHLLLRPARARLLIALTCRTETAGAVSLHARLVSDIERTGRATTTVSLDGLDPAQLGAMAAGIVGDRAEGELDDAVVGALHAATRGNPFFVRETVRYLLETGTLSTGRVLAVPDSVRAVVERRLAVLPPSCRHVLEAAAVIGHDISLGLLTAVCAQTEESVLEALEAAVDAQLVVEQGDADEFAFTHPVVRRTLDAGMLRSRALRVHLAVADALERRDSGAGDVIAVALHLRAAGAAVPPDRLHRTARAAAEQAMDILAYEEAVPLFDVALATAAAVGVPAVDRIDLEIGRGEALVQSGDPRGRSALQEAGEHARREGTTAQLARAVFSASQESVGIAYDDPVFIGMLEDALSAVGPEDSTLRARVLGRLGFELFAHDPSDRGARLTGDAVEMALRLGDPATLAVVLSHRRFYGLGLDSILADGATVLEQAGRSGNPALALPGHVFLASARLQQADLSGVATAIDTVEQCALELRRPRMQWWAAHARGVLAGAARDLDESDTLIAAALDIGQRTGESNAVGFYFCQAFPNALLRGQLGGTEDALRAYLTDVPSTLGSLALPLVACHAGDPARGEAELDHLAADGFRPYRQDSTWIASLAALSEAAAFVGRRDLGAELEALLLPHAGTMVDISACSGCFGPVDRILGVLANLRGDLDDAITRLEAAVALCRRGGAIPWLALSQHQLAARLGQRRRGDDDNRARELADGARDLAAGSGVVLPDDAGS